jgi:hypothetical protein
VQEICGKKAMQDLSVYEKCHQYRKAEEMRQYITSNQVLVVGKSVCVVIV